MVIETFAGDWWDASQIYRKWALAEASSWTRAGPLAARAKRGAHGVAQWLIDTPLWAQGGGGARPSAANWAPQLAEHLDLKKMTHPCPHRVFKEIF